MNSLIYILVNDVRTTQNKRNVLIHFLVVHFSELHGTYERGGAQIDVFCLNFLKSSLSQTLVVEWAEEKIKKV